MIKFYKGVIAMYRNSNKHAKNKRGILRVRSAFDKIFCKSRKKVAQTQYVCSELVSH